MPIIALCIWIGLYPAPIFRVMQAPVDKLVRQIGRTYYPDKVAAGGSETVVAPARIAALSREVSAGGRASTATPIVASPDDGRREVGAPVGSLASLGGDAPEPASGGALGAAHRPPLAHPSHVGAGSERAGGAGEGL